MRPWLGERTADLLTNAMHALESCGDPTGEEIGFDLRRFLEDGDVAFPPGQTSTTAQHAPEAQQRASEDLGGSE